jgi:transposase
MESHFLAETEWRDIGAYTQATFKTIIKDIEVIEKEMDVIIQMDAGLCNLMKIMTSIPYIGKVIATEILIRTNEFKDFTSPKKFASYCGIAPFEKTSGTSVRKKPKISHIANKDMKKLLHLASLGATRNGKSQFRTYYARKVKEGKNGMSVLNAVRNKLVGVIFACVRENKPYESPVLSKQQPQLPTD